MSSSRSRANSAPESAFESGDVSGMSRSRAATVQDSIIETVTETSEPRSSASEERPKLKDVRRGILSISEASVPLAQSSPILAKGEISTSQPGNPGHKVNEEVTCETGINQAGDQPADDSGPDPGTAEKAQGIQEPPAERQATHSDEAYPDDRVLEAPAPLAHQEEHTNTEALEQFSTVPIPSVPIIEIHRPSDANSTMAVLETNVLHAASGSTPATPMPSMVDSAAPASTSGITSRDGIPANPPVSSAGELDAAPVPTGPPVGGKVKKRKKMVNKARKTFLRKRMLAFILGRKLAGTVHPLLSGAGAAPISVPVGVSGVPV